MKDKKATILILAILLSLTTPAAISENDKFSVDYIFESVLMDGQYHQWMIKDAQTLEVPGEPLVPYRTAQILLPQGTELKNVKVKHGKPIVQTGIDLLWGQLPCTFSDTPVKVGRNEETYNSNNWYPGKLFEVIGVEYFRGFAVLNVHLFPIQYQPKSQTVNFYEKLTVELQFGKGVKNKLYRGLPDDKTTVASMVDNPETLDTYEPGSTPLATEEYIIITNDTMQSTFQQLATWKADFVSGTGVYTVSWITSNYSGVDNQEKIRNFIIDKYTNNGTEYVLLGGDIAAVPYRGFYIYSGGYVDYDMLADMYFSHLDGNWNNDGDSRYAEPGEEDWYAEVAVGRAPVENTTEAQHFVDKVIAYEQKDKPHRVLLHSSWLNDENNPDSSCLPYNCDDWVPGDYYIDYLIEDGQTITKSVWIEHWGYNPLAVEHFGLGNTNVYYLNYSPSVSWYNSDVASLTNTFWPWHTSPACNCGQIEANDCLAEAYVKDANNGAIATIFNDNYGWFSTLDACMYSGEFCEMEFRACWNDGYEKFGDMLNQCRNYMVSSASSNSTYRWCFYERNLVGDPESPCLTKRGGQPPDTVTITYPLDESIVCGIVTITVSITGDIDEVRFYIDGAHKYTDTISPFSWDWNTRLYSNGEHTICVKGYCNSVPLDEDTANVTVNNEEYIIITNSTLQSTFQRLADWKADFVSGTGVYTVSWIYSNYAGVDNQEKIRNFIKDKYINKCTKYVLLGGDIAVVPYRGFYVYSGGYAELDLPADMYYGHLDGTFNDDGDSRYAEPGEVDWDAEVAVGRAPVETVAEAEAFVDKVIAYEQMEKPKVIVLHQSRVQPGNNPDSRCLAWNCDDWVPPDYEIIYLFEEDGTITKAAWRNAWAANPLIIVHMGDGNTNVHYINYEIGGSVSWYNSDVSSLANTFFPVFMSPASFVGDFRVNDCLAEEYVKDANNGAIAAIANASYAWYSTNDACQYCGEFIEMMFKALFYDGKEHLGDMLNQGKSYMVSSAQSNSTYRWCFYAFNLIGDPETPVLTKRNPPEEYIIITNPTEGSTVSGIVNVTTSTTGGIDEVRFYINGVLKHTDYTEPFTWDWDTTQYQNKGGYRLKAEGYKGGVCGDDDEIRVKISNPSIALLSFLVLFLPLGIVKRH